VELEVEMVHKVGKEGMAAMAQMEHLLETMKLLEFQYLAEPDPEKGVTAVFQVPAAKVGMLVREGVLPIFISLGHDLSVETSGLQQCSMADRQVR
jgi:hypothetical protein